MRLDEQDDFQRVLASLLTEYARAARDKDVDALVALYTEDVYVFDAWDRWTYEGRAAWREMVSAWFQSVGDDQIAVTVSDLTAAGAGDIAFGHALVRFASIGADGHELCSILNRHSWGLTCLDGTWRIRHEHSSVPVGFSSRAAIGAVEKA